MHTTYYLHSLASTPSIDLDPEDHDGTQRRNSSGTLLSPEVDAGGESDGFYLLKKDSQRRTTLAKVFAQDGSKICDLWLSKIRSKFLGETVLTTEHLMKVIAALKDFLTDQTKNTLHNTISTLRTEFCLDEGAVNQLQLAIYLFQVRIIKLIYVNINLMFFFKLNRNPSMRY